MMVFKRNQIVVLSLVLVILVAGYLQYTYKKGSTANSASRLGEAVYVENPTVADTDSGDADTVAANAAANSDKSTAGTSKASDGKSAEASKAGADSFALTKLEREQSRSQSADSLKAIANDETASKDVRDTANEQRIKLIQVAEKEARIEALIKDKNFDDAAVTFADDGSIDIVVKTSQLSSAQCTQIADIAARQAKVSMDLIHVRAFN